MHQQGICCRRHRAHAAVGHAGNSPDGHPGEGCALPVQQGPSPQRGTRRGGHPALRRLTAPFSSTTLCGLPVFLGSPFFTGGFSRGKNPRCVESSFRPCYPCARAHHAQGSSPLHKGPSAMHKGSLCARGPKSCMGQRQVWKTARRLDIDAIWSTLMCIGRTVRPIGTKMFLTLSQITSRYQNCHPKRRDS